MNREQWSRLKPGDRVVAVDIGMPGLLWHPVPGRPKLGKTYVVQSIGELPYEDIMVKGLDGGWARSRFKLK